MRCPRCLLAVARCVCAEIPTVATRTRVLIVRHMMERHKPSNTARLAALAIPTCEVVDYGLAAGAPLAFEPGAWLLYPGGETGTGAAPRQLVVLDGSWPQTRRMAQRIPALRGLPRLSFPTRPAVERMRRAPLPEGMATLEAIARALEVLEGPEVARPLDALFAEVVRRSRMG
jgi:DTW domain-containing protein